MQKPATCSRILGYDRAVAKTAILLCILWGGKSGQAASVRFGLVCTEVRPDLLGVLASGVVDGVTGVSERFARGALPCVVRSRCGRASSGGRATPIQTLRVALGAAVKCRGGTCAGRKIARFPNYV